MLNTSTSSTNGQSSLTASVDLVNYGYHGDYTRQSNSLLKAFREDRRMYRDVYVRKVRQPSDPTGAMEIGTALHMLVFEKEKFNASYLVADRKYGSSKADKRELTMIAESHPGKGILFPQEMDVLVQMRRAIIEDDAGRWMIESEGLCEEVFLWKDPTTGVLMRMKLDKLISDESNGKMMTIFDLKTCADASSEAFARSIDKYSYHCQNAVYRSGLREAIGLSSKDPVRFLFGAISKPTKDSMPKFAMYELDEFDVQAGERLTAKTLNDLMYCLATDIWADPESGSIRKIQRSHWARSQDPD